MNITITSPASQPLLSTPVNSGAKGYYSLMQHDYITLPFSLQSPVEFGIGSYADLREAFSDALGGKLAKIYKVCDLQTPTYNTSTGGYDYELRLDAYYWLWKNKIFKYTPEVAGQEASWSLTASLDVHLGVFLRNLDALGETYGEKEYEFSIGSTVENKAVAITYDNTNLIDALSRMAEAWGCEWWVTENVIHFGRLENGDAVELEIGVQAEDMTRNESKGTYATRIYAFGSTRNIPENYRPNDNEDLTVNGVVQKRLMLPADTPYIDARPGLTEQEVVESVVVFDDIYPRRVGTLSDVKTVDRAIEDEDGNQTGTFKAYQYKDTGLTFSPDYVLKGQELRIVFQSGKMNGLDFGVTFNPDNADPAEQLWEIVANEDYGRRLPDEVIKPENGDTYILYGFDIKLVSDQYIPAAEQELKAKAEEYVAKTQVDDGTYTVPLYSSWVEADEVNRTFDAGQRVKLKNPAFFGTSGRTSRVIGWEMCLDIPYDRPVYTIGESAQYSRLGELEDKVDSLTLNGQAYQGIGGGSGVYLIRTNDSTPASNSNAYSALRARQEFLSKTKDDTAKGKITFVKGIDVGTFSQNAGGGTFRVLEDLTTYAEVDKLRVRVKAYFETLEIINTNSVGGKMILTAGGGVYLREVKDRETLEDGTVQVWDHYRCFFLTEQDGREVENRFHVGDLAMSQSFNIKAGTHQGVTNHYYWREVVGIGDDYIDLSKTICDTGSDAPMAEDTVCHLGNRSDKDRQGAIIFSAVDVFSPSITLYYGINDFSLVNKDYVSYGVDKSTGNAFFRVYGEMYAGDREQTSYVKYTPGVGVEMRGKFLNQAGESYDTIIDSIQNAIDGNIETWFGEEEPTLQNYPASEWTTDEDKNTHLGDLYYSDAGVAYRFQMEGANYVWKMLKDSDITKALADAKAAKDSADAAQEAADAAADRLTAWASDGVISPTEKQGIKDEIARIDADKANITAQYTKYGLGTPTAFNSAYTAYRAVLVSLSASTPENIAIPSDFSSKQTYYYNERTSALGAIADASITSVNNVTEQLEKMQQDFAEVKQDVAGVKTSVDGLKNFTDEAFADGIVDRNESAAIASHVNSIETFAKDAAESYTKVYDNPLLTGTAKTNLANAYTAFTTAKTELVTTINGAIADGLVDALEKSAVDGKYTAFNTKYGDFVANLNAANRAIQDAINQNALQALQKIGELDYLKAALKEFTTIEGGLIQSSTLALGYTSDSGYQVMAGTNGIYDASKLGGGIASWWGGAMFDRFEYTEETMPENVASALVRMDGTGYFAKGNLWWESDGTLHADPLSFFVGEDSVGDVLGLFQFVKSDAGIEYVIPQYPFQKLEIGNYLQIGKAQLYWDEANQAFYVRHQDGVSPVGFYATGFISTKGANPDAGGSVSGASSLDELSDVALSGLQDGQVLAYDTATQKWVNKTQQAGLDETALAQYLTANQYVTMPTGDGRYALKGGSNASGTWPISITGSAKILALQDTRSVNTAPFTGGRGLHYHFKYNTADGLNDGGTYHSVLQFNQWEEQSGGFCKQLALTDAGNMWFRNASSSTAWGSWQKVLTTSNYASTLDTRYVKKAGDTMTGTLTLSTTGSHLYNQGIRINRTALNQWATLTIGYVGTATAGTSANTWLIGTPSNSNSLVFNLNSASESAGLCLKGHGNTDMKWNNQTVWHAGNDGSGSGLDADLLDGYQYTSFDHVTNLTGIGDYGMYVIGLLQITDYTTTGNHARGRLVFTRTNGNNPVCTIFYNLSTTYNSTTPRFAYLKIGIHNTDVKPCTFTYNGKKYAGFATTLSSSYSSGVQVMRAGLRTGERTTPFIVRYKTSNTGTVNNSEINGSLATGYSVGSDMGIFSPKIVVGNSLQIGNGTISWDSSTNAFHFSHGVYSDSFISAKGSNSGAGGSVVAGATKLSDLDDVTLGTLATNQVLSWNGSKWVNKTLDMGLDETALAQYLTNNQYLTMPTGDGRYALKGGSNATGTWPISITRNAATATKLALIDTRSVNTAPFAYGNGLVYLFKFNTADGLNDGGTYHSVLQFDQWEEQSGGLCKQLALTDGGNMWFRNASSATAWGAWKKLLDSSNYSSIIGNSFVKKAGDTMTGKLTVPSLAVSGSTATVAGNTVWHAGNDGSGSGLDADLLDGYNASSFESYRLVTINASSLNQNTWYPVTMVIGNSLRTRIRIEGHTSANASWNTRADKFMALYLDYSTNGSMWGWTTVTRYVNAYVEGAGTSSCLRGLGQLTSTSTEYVYVRGGAVYNFYVSRFITPVLRTSTYTVENQSVSPTTTMPAAISRNVAFTTDTVYAAQRLATASTINGTAFDGTSNIVTSYWGTARNFYIRDHDSSHTGAAVSVNGSANEYLLLPSTITASLNGNATSASYWQTARTLTVSGDATGSVSIRGNANMSLSLDVNYATSAGNADTLDGYHESSFFRNTISTVAESVASIPANRSGSYVLTHSGWSGSAFTLYASCSNSTLGFMIKGGQYANVNLITCTDSNTSRWRDNGYIITTTNIGSYNAGSATRLQTARTIWGQSFNGTANVSGNMTGVGGITGSGSISMSGSITAGAYVYSSGWFQNQQSGEGLYNNAVDARWYANSSGWISDKKINANAGLGVSGTSTLSGAVQVPYTAGSWISMATRTNLIYSTTNNSQSGAHALFRVKAYNGNAICFGGLGNNVGFYAFTAANISSGTNAIWKSTYWDMTNWTLHHGGVLHCTGGIYSDSYVSAKGNNSSSDIRLKNILCHIRPSMEAFAKAPLFRFAWKSDPGMVEIGSSAQYWRNVLPDTVKERDGWLEMGYGNIALAGVITIARDFETLEQRVDRLEKENGKLKKRIKELERRAA